MNVRERQLVQMQRKTNQNLRRTYNSKYASWFTSKTECKDNLPLFSLGQDGSRILSKQGQVTGNYLQTPPIIQKLPCELIYLGSVTKHTITFKYPIAFVVIQTSPWVALTNCFEDMKMLIEIYVIKLLEHDNGDF